VNTEVRSGDRLAKSGRRCNWRQKRKDDLDVVGTRVLRSNLVCKVGYRGIILRAFINGVRDVVAMIAISSILKGVIAETDVWSFPSRES
jgi:hypothetical protein